MRRLQTAGDLDPGAQDLRFRELRVLRHAVVEAAVIDQFHHEIDLVVGVTGGVNLDDVGMIDRGGQARFLFETGGFNRIGAQFFAEQFQRDETIEPRVARFIDGAHAANAEGLDQLEIIERTLGAEFFAAGRAGYRGERLSVADIDRDAAGGAGLGRRVGGGGHLREGSIRNFSGKVEDDFARKVFP